MNFEEWLSQQTGTIEVDCGCVTTEAFYHWLRIAYEAGNSPEIPDGYVLVPREPTEEMNKAGWAAMNEHDAINPTYRAMLAAAPTGIPMISARWIPVSEHLPDVGDIVLTAIDGCVNVGEMERSGDNYRYFTSVISGRELPATHWMQLPAAPQEVKGE